MPRDSMMTRTGLGSRTNATGLASSFVIFAFRGPSGVPTATATTGMPSAAANSAALAGGSPALDWPSVSSRMPATGWPRCAAIAWRMAVPRAVVERSAIVPRGAGVSPAFVDQKRGRTPVPRGVRRLRRRRRLVRQELRREAASAARCARRSTRASRAGPASSSRCDRSSARLLAQLVRPRSASAPSVSRVARRRRRCTRRAGPCCSSGPSARCRFDGTNSCFVNTSTGSSSIARMPSSTTMRSVPSITRTGSDRFRPSRRYRYSTPHAASGTASSSEQRRPALGAATRNCDVPVPARPPRGRGRCRGGFGCSRSHHCSHRRPTGTCGRDAASPLPSRPTPPTPSPPRPGTAARPPASSRSPGPARSATSRRRRSGSPATSRLPIRAASSSSVIGRRSLSALLGLAATVCVRSAPVASFHLSA